jgi:hypothetical protein
MSCRLASKAGQSKESGDHSSEALTHPRPARSRTGSPRRSVSAERPVSSAPDQPAPEVRGFEGEDARRLAPRVRIGVISDSHGYLDPAVLVGLGSRRPHRRGRRVRRLRAGRDLCPARAQRLLKLRPARPQRPKRRLASPVLDSPSAPRTAPPRPRRSVAPWRTAAKSTATRSLPQSGQLTCTLSASPSCPVISKSSPQFQQM